MLTIVDTLCRVCYIVALFLGLYTVQSEYGYLFLACIVGQNLVYWLRLIEQEKRVSQLIEMVDVEMKRRESGATLMSVKDDKNDQNPA